MSKGLNPFRNFVVVEWDDSAADGVAGWQTIDNGRKAGAEGLYIVSVGILIDKKPDYIIIARGVDNQLPNQHADGFFRIPRGCIKRLRKLGVK